MSSFLEPLWRDVRFALRMLSRTPGFAATAIVTVALGIGANSAIFSVASGMLLRPLPYPAADRLAMVWMDNSRISLREDWHSFANYADYRAGNTTLRTWRLQQQVAPKAMTTLSRCSAPTAPRTCSTSCVRPVLRTRVPPRRKPGANNVA
jgi:hypothetical protein